MNIRPMVLSAGAAALLCLVPRASAVTITQTSTITSRGGTLQTTGISINTWNMAEFGETRSLLNSVEVTRTGHAVVTIMTYNPFSFEVSSYGEARLTPQLNISNWFFSSEQQVQRDFSGASNIPASGSAVNTVEIDYSFSTLFTSPADLARFIGTGTEMITSTNVVRGIGPYTTPQFTVTETVSLAYNYSVPDSGNTLIIFGLALGLCLAAHRRINPLRTL